MACGIRAIDAPLLIERIRHRWPDARLSIDGKPARPGLAALVRETRRATTIGVVARTGQDQAVWQFVLYDRSGTSSYVSRQGAQAVGGVLYGDVLDRNGADDLTQRMPELVRHANSLPIDLVYAWVDGTTPNGARPLPRRDPG